VNGLDAAGALQLEMAKLRWEFAAREVDLHKDRHLQMLAISLTGAVTAMASVWLEKVPPGPGAILAALLVAAAAFFHWRIRLLPRLLRAALEQGIRSIGSLIPEEAA
jgi:hypothetical protein